MSNLREINELLHRFFEEYPKWILLSLLFPAFGFKTIPEAFKIIVLPTTTTVCGKINRLPPGNQLEITVIRTHKKSRIGSPQISYNN